MVRVRDLKATSGRFVILTLELELVYCRLKLKLPGHSNKNQMAYLFPVQIFNIVLLRLKHLQGCACMRVVSVGQ